MWWWWIGFLVFIFLIVFAVVRIKPRRGEDSYNKALRTAKNSTARLVGGIIFLAALFAVLIIEYRFFALFYGLGFSFGGSAVRISVPLLAPTSPSWLFVDALVLLVGACIDRGNRNSAIEKKDLEEAEAKIDNEQ